MQCKESSRLPPELREPRSCPFPPAVDHACGHENRVDRACAGPADGVKSDLRFIQQPVKDTLRTNTQEAIDRGSFGSPTIFVGGDDMYFGNDRMPLLKDAVLRRRK